MSNYDTWYDMAGFALAFRDQLFAKWLYRNSFISKKMYRAMREPRVELGCPKAPDPKTGKSQDGGEE